MAGNTQKIISGNNAYICRKKGNKIIVFKKTGSEGQNTVLSILNLDTRAWEHENKRMSFPVKIRSMIENNFLQS